MAETIISPSHGTMAISTWCPGFNILGGGYRINLPLPPTFKSANLTVQTWDDTNGWMDATDVSIGNSGTLGQVTFVPAAGVSFPQGQVFLCAVYGTIEY